MLAAIATFALAVRVAYIVVTARHLPLAQDALWYTLVSGPIANGKGFLAPGPYFSTGRTIATAAYPPLYPGFLALVTRVVNGRPDTFRYAGAVCGTATVVLTGLVGRRVAGVRVGLVAAALAAVYPSLIAVDGALLSETVSIPLALGALLVTISAIEHPTAWRYAMAGALFGAMLLARADAFVPATIVVATGAVASRGSLRRAVVQAGAAAVAMIAVVTPWLIRNDVRVGTASIATVSSAATLAGANCASTYHGHLVGFWDFSCMNAERQASVEEAAWARETRTLGLHYARAHGTRVPLVVLVRELRVLGVFHPFSQARAERAEGRSYGWQIVAWACWLPVMVFGTVGLLRLARAERRAWPLVAIVASVLVVAALSYGNQRFRTTGEPAMLIGAASIVVSATSTSHVAVASARSEGDST